MDFEAIKVNCNSLEKNIFFLRILVLKIKIVEIN